MSLGGRRLVPEILDGLRAEDPRARRSRADLRRINVVMRQTTIADGLIGRYLDLPAGRPPRLLELGAGDGVSMLRLARRLSRRYPAATLTLLDAAPAVSAETLADFTALGWTLRVVTADAIAWLTASGEDVDLALSNLFLHHFAGADLARLLRAIAMRAGLFVATEPLRSVPSLVASGLVGLIGANDVTRHDAPASVRAGFRGGELGALWRPEWGEVVAEGARVPFTHAFAARSHAARPIGASA